MSKKLPTVRIKLVGEDGNAYAIIGRVRAAARKAGWPAAAVSELTAYLTTAHSYDELLQRTAERVKVT